MCALRCVWIPSSLYHRSKSSLIQMSRRRSACWDLYDAVECRGRVRQLLVCARLSRRAKLRRRRRRRQHKPMTFYLNVITCRGAGDPCRARPIQTTGQAHKERFKLEWACGKGYTGRRGSRRHFFLLLLLLFFSGLRSCREITWSMDRWFIHRAR